MARIAPPNNMPVAPSFKVNMKPLFAALDEFQRHSRKDFADNLQLAGRGVIRNVVAITPPNRIEEGGEGESDTAVSGVSARQQGEAAIMSDLYRIFFPASAGFMKKFLHANPDGTRAQDFHHPEQKSIGTVLVQVMPLDRMRAFHKSKKGSNGRVRGGGEGGRLNFDRAQKLTTGTTRAGLQNLEYAIVSPADFKAYAKMIKDRVGWLGHGWGPAAARLKVTMPTYMTRFEGSNGSISTVFGPDKFYIRAANNIAWASNVRGYQSRLQSAVNRQASAFAKRTAYFLDRRGQRLAAKH